MSTEPTLQNRLRQQRLARGWSQDEVAGRAGIARTSVSAIENERLVPSAAAALALAAAFQCRVEDLFSLTGAPLSEPQWASPPLHADSRFWEAEVAGQNWRYPVESTSGWTTPHDGVCRAGAITLREDVQSLARQTLVMACCDPTAGLLAGELLREQAVRVVVLPRSSRQALELVKRGMAHVAGVHLSRGDGAGNADAVRDSLGPGYQLLRIARWQEGIAFQTAERLTSVRSALRQRLTWVGREAGSGAAQCLEELFDGRALPRRLARDHRGVADAIRCGWAQVGVCLRVAGEEAGLGFLPVREEAYDLCFSSQLAGDPRIAALLRSVRSAGFRRILSDVPGYDVSTTGGVATVS